MLNVRNDLIKYRGPLRVTPKGLAYISVILSALAEREGILGALAKSSSKRTCWNMEYLELDKPNAPPHPPECNDSMLSPKEV